MPIREYVAASPGKSCPHCKEGFEQMEAMDAPNADRCPECGNPVQRRFSAPNVGGSKSNLHDRAKNAGFTTFKKTGQGEYEKKY